LVGECPSAVAPLALFVERDPQSATVPDAQLDENAMDAPAREIESLGSSLRFLSEFPLTEESGVIAEGLSPPKERGRDVAQERVVERRPVGSRRFAPHDILRTGINH
jgi:hypothetical protein